MTDWADDIAEAVFIDWANQRHLKAIIARTLRDERKATIERCAVLAEDTCNAHNSKMDAGALIAAAIREHSDEETLDNE